MFLIMNYFHPNFAPFAFFVASLIPMSFSLCVAADSSRVIETGPAEKLVLPPPYATRGVANPSRVVGWPKGKMPTTPAGFEVNLFAEDLDNPRTIHVLPNGDVLVMESRRRQGPSRLILFRDDHNEEPAAADRERHQTARFPNRMPAISMICPITEPS